MAVKKKSKLSIVPKRGSKAPKAIKPKEDLCAEACLLLEVPPDAVISSTKIEQLFKGIGGKVAVLQYLEGSEEPEARKVVELRRRLSNRQADAVPFEAYCIAAGVTVKKMFGIIAQEVSDQSEKATELLSRARHTEVVEATITNALLPFGGKDREMLHKARGFVPVPKNSTTNVFGNQNIDARHQQAAVAVLPPVENGMRRLGDRFNKMMEEGSGARALPAPVLEDILEGDDDEEE